MIDIEMNRIIDAIKHTESGEIKFDIDEDTHIVHGVEIDDQYIKIVAKTDKIDTDKI